MVTPIIEEAALLGLPGRVFRPPGMVINEWYRLFPILNEPPVILLKWGKPLIRSGESWAKRILSARTDFRAAIVISLFADSQHSDWATIIAYGIDPSRVFSGHAETHYPPRLSKWLSVSCTVGLATHQRPPRSILIGGSGEAQVPWKYRLVAIAL